jgi:alpha-maltose-1-phosphate synthase
LILLSHPTGNANVRAAAHAFYAAGLLKEFDTSISWDPNSALRPLIPKRVAMQMARRSFPDIPRHLQHTHPWREFARLVSPGSFLKRGEAAPLSVFNVCRRFDQHVAARLETIDDLKAVYAYEDCALSTFQSASHLGLRRIYDLPIGYWRAAHTLYDEERELQPAWACTLTGLKDSPEKLERKDLELNLADSVVVASHFVRSTLLDYASFSAPIVLVPYGTPPPSAELVPPVSSGPLRVLFVGSLGQRKGLSYLLEAVDQLGDAVQLTLIGKPASTDCQPLVAALQHHRWITTLPHSQILEQMRQHDVFVFPSLFEGFGLVLTEALSQGLPIISTPNTAAPDLIKDGREGFIVPIRDSHAIADRLLQLVDNRDRLNEMREASLRRAAAMPWSWYEHKLVESLQEWLD